MFDHPCLRAFFIFFTIGSIVFAPKISINTVQYTVLAQML